MKTTTLITSLLILLLSFTSFAGNGERLLKKKLNSKIHYPELLSGKKVETEVLVQLSVNNAGEVVIHQIESDDAEVRAAIGKQLEKITVTPDEELIGKTFYYRFLLKVQ